jgi:hypothetical protein
MSRYATILLLLATAPALAACGSSNSSTPVAAAKAAQPIAFAKCMRSHGVPNFPDPSSSNGGGIQIQASDRAGSGQSLSVNGVSVNAPAFQSAMKACQSYMPKRGKLPPGGLASMRANGLKFAACMRSHGVPNFPDPQIQSGPGGGVGVRIGGPGSGLDPRSPAFQSAQKACGSLFGGAGPKQVPAG